MIETQGEFEERGYELISQVVEDRWGVLYRARYSPHDLDVLLRAFPPSLAGEPKAWDLMSAEISAWARLNHPGVLGVLDWGMSEKGPYAAYRAPSGAPLAELLASGPAEDPDSLFAQILEAVETARRWGILHLGLGGSSIWAGPRVEVSEFGFWYVTGEYPAAGIGDEAFLAPEQRKGERVSAATDVYTLGLLLVALRLGLQAARDAVGGAPLPEALGEIRGIVARCLDERPLARLRSAGELAAELGVDIGPPGGREFMDCPLCRLKRELSRRVMSEEARGAGDAEQGERCGTLRAAAGIDYRRLLPWALIVCLAAASVAVWLFALK